MKRMTNVLRLLFVFLFVVLLSAGCGGGGSDDGGGGNPTPPAPEVETSVVPPVEVGNSGGGISNDGGDAEDATTQGKNLKLIGEWLYMDTGEALQLTSETELNYEVIDEQLLKVTDSDNKTRFLVRSGHNNVKVRGLVTRLTNGSEKVSGSGAKQRPRGIGGMSVVLRNIKDRETKRETETKDDGEFEAEHVVSGDYEIVIKDESDEEETIITIPDVKIEGEEVNLGVFTVTGEGLYNFKTELLLNSEYLYDRETYTGNIRIKNVGDLQGSGLNFDISSDDESIKSLDVGNKLGSIPPGENTDIPVTFTFNPLTTSSGHKNIKITVKINDANHNTWEDYIFIDVYKHKANLNIATASAGVKGYLIVPGHKLIHIDTNSSTFELPIRKDKKYQLVLSDSNLSDETAYSIGVGRGTIAFEGFSDTAAHEPNDKESEATTLNVNESITSYLHAGDIDYYSIDMSTLPSAPINVKAVPGDEQVTLKWSTVNEATSYNIYWSTNSGVSKSNYEGVFPGITETSYTHMNLMNGVRSYYVITEIVSNGESNESEEVSALPKVQAPTNGLVAYYPFNGNAGDESGNGNDGTVEGATLTGDRFGNVDRAYVFDGSGAYVTILDSGVDTALDLNGNQFTFGVWVNITSYSGDYRGIVGKIGWTDSSLWSYNFHIRDDGALHVNFVNTEGNSFPLNSTKTIGSGWHHVAATYDGSIEKLYIDGSEVASMTASGDIRQNDYPVSIGRWWSRDTNYFNGSIDDLRLYNRALSELEIQDLYLYNESGNYYAPEADAGPDKTVYPYETVVNLDGSGSSDTDGDTLTYKWTITSQPDGSFAEFSDSNVASPAFSQDLEGTYVMTLIVNDGLFNSIADTVTVEVIDYHIGIVMTPGDNEITINWDRISDATSYNLYWSTSSSISKNNYEGKITNLTSTTYTHSGVTKGTTYYYAVSAVTSMGESNVRRNALNENLFNNILTYNGHSYGVTKSVMTWQEAKTLAEKNDAYLVAINNSVENQFLTESYKPSGSNYLWIGYNDINTEGEWVWENGELSNYKNWGRSEPNNSGNEDCTHMWGATWNDWKCSSNIYAIVEFEAGASALLSDPPVNIVITPEDSQITISWNEVPDALSYNIYWAETADVTTTNGTKIFNVASPYIHTNISNGTTYYYIVTVENYGGESSGSVVESMLLPPNYPAGITALVADKQATISWDSVTGADSYNIYWSEIPSVDKFNGTKIANAESPYTHTGRTNLSTYYYIVTAVNATGESAESVEVSALLPPDPPTGIAVSADFNETTITWNTVTGAETYNIYWSETPGVTKATGAKISNVTSPYTHTGRTNNKKYYYVSIAVASGVESGESIEVNVLLPPDSPKVVTAGAGDSKITVRWKNVEGAESYNIYWSGENNVTKENGTLIENVSRPFDHLNLSNDTTYYYVVTALNNSAESNDSNKIASTPREAVYSYNFEGGMGNWSTDNGLWAAGAPTSGPNDAFSGINVAGTVLDGNYPRYTDSRLISPPIDLPIIFDDEEIQLRFFQWFSYSRNRRVDAGYIQVSVQDENTNEWSNWVSVGNSVTDSSPRWSQMGVDLTPYSGKRIRIAFYHTDDFYRYASEVNGWYVDNINIFIRQPEFPGKFELGWGDWMADRGVWQVGNGSAVTVIGGKYPRYTDSRLISPSVTLPTILAGENIDLRFDHSFSYSRNRRIDAGYIQISVQDEITKNWSAWTSISSAITDKSPISQMSVDLTPYSGKKIRIAFYHTDDFYRYASEESGWTIKDVKIVRY